MKRVCALLLLNVACGVQLVAAAAPEPDAPGSRELHVAECVAALKANTENLASQVKAGAVELKPTLLSRLEQGAAFVGSSYLDGHGDEDRSNALLDAATQAQKSLSPQALADRQAACSKEGANLLASANPLNRAIVKQLARNRMGKLLAANAPSN